MKSNFVAAPARRMRRIALPPRQNGKHGGPFARFAVVKLAPPRGRPPEVLTPSRSRLHRGSTPEENPHGRPLPINRPIARLRSRARLRLAARVSPAGPVLRPPVTMPAMDIIRATADGRSRYTRGELSGRAGFANRMEPNERYGEAKRGTRGVKNQRQPPIVLADTSPRRGGFASFTTAGL